MNPTDDHTNDDFDLGLQHDLMRLVSRRRMLRYVAGAGAGAVAATTLAGRASAACVLIPEETAGPYPGDGSNGPNVLTQSGIVRSDIRSSFGSMTGTAEGVPLQITLRLTDVTNCGVLQGAAVYLWHCDRDGKYSLYSSGITNQNYLRGVQVTDANGEVTFTTIFPACYSGRWPHAHFEVYPNLASATSAANKIATSQIAFPKATCDQVYATSGYGSSVTALANVSLASDNVFGNDDGVTQLAVMTGSVAAGFTSTLDVGVDADGAGVVASSEITITPTTSPATIGAASAYVPLAASRRVLDTRSASQNGYVGSKPLAMSTFGLQVLGRGTVPVSGVSAVVLNMVITEPEAPGFLTVWPDGSRPNASCLNVDTAGQTRANVVTVPVAGDGTVQIYTLPSAHVVADVLGYFAPAATAAAGRLITLNPSRLLDTRPATRVGYSGSKPAAGSTVSVVIAGRGDVPSSGVSAVVFNVTATETAAPGFVTAQPDNVPPSTSSVNFDRVGQTVANQVIVPIDPDGSVRLYVSAETHLVVDVFGYYTDSTAATSTSGLFVPVSPYRVADTRNVGLLGAGGVLHLRASAVGTAAAGKNGLAVNLTATEPRAAGFLTVWPEGDRPETSNLNMIGVNTIANQVTVATGANGVEIYTLSATHVVVDITGWYL